MRRRTAALVASSLLAATGCSGSAAQVTIQPPPAAKVYRVTGFTPAGPVTAGAPTTVSFTITQPSGKPLVHYATGAGPHVGVHLIFVRRDLAQIVHLHPPIRPNGVISTPVTFPSPGPWQLLIDAYLPGSPSTPLANRNFQLRENVTVAGTYRPRPIGAVRTRVTTGGYTFTIERMPKLRVATAQFLSVTVRDAAGHPVTFTPWFGALAHAVFFRQRTLAYFHTHICSPKLALCAAGSPVSGSSTAPGHLKIGMVFPLAGKWRMFLQGKVGGTILTAPFTLDVRS